MTFRTFLRSSAIVILGVFLLALHPQQSSAGNARIIRLSLVQGEVRVLRDSKGDPLANDKANWERAELNLPIRQHYVIATDSGRAEVEFENGAMAFINENSVLEFFDLSLEDGALTTRLILRQGTATFYVNPARGDYFSVTGGDFTAEAGNHSNFRLDNFDDGSTVAVFSGRVNVVHKDDNTVLAKGQSLTMRAGENVTAALGRLPEDDDFDRWVSGRADSVTTATNASLQYSNSSTYTSGFGDLYSYGGFYPVSGFGYGWRPFGAGIGWSPFDYGNWFFDSSFGWSFIGNQPWGWLPYHYGGWIFQPGIGWLWAPTGFGRGLPPAKFHPVTATFVRSGNNVGIVPSHPLDNHGKTPLNLSHGIVPWTNRGATQTALDATSKWRVVKEPPREALTSKASPASAPARVARTVSSSEGVARMGATVGRTIVYDPKEHRFVNSNVPAAAVTASGATRESSTPATPAANGTNASAAAGARVTVVPRQGRVAAPPSASSRIAGPPPVPRSTVITRGESSRGVSGSRGATMQSGSSSRSSTPAPASTAPHVSSGSGRPH
jgi:hypothetical protein